MKKTAIIIAGMSLTSAAFTASAGNDFAINGFINVVGAISDSKTNYLDDITDNGSFNDTSLGLVFSKRISSKVTVATQLHGQHETFGFDWGYITYKIDADFSAKAGKIKYAGNLLSETADVGNTFPWVRPPASIYGDTANVSYEAYTGSSLMYTFGDDIEYSAEFFIGETEAEKTANKRMLGVVLTANTDNIQAKFSYNSSIMLMNNFNPSNPNQVLMNDSTMTNTALSLKAEYDMATILTEYVITDMERVPDDNIAWYVTVLHNIKTWTPHFTYQSYENMFGRDETSYTLGLNKQLDSATVAKIEIQVIDPTNGGFFEEPPEESSINVLSISLSMVF